MRRGRIAVIVLAVTIAAAGTAVGIAAVSGSNGRAPVVLASEPASPLTLTRLDGPVIADDGWHQATCVADVEVGLSGDTYRCEAGQVFAVEVRHGTIVAVDLTPVPSLPRIDMNPNAEVGGDEVGFRWIRYDGADFDRYVFLRTTGDALAWPVSGDTVALWSSTDRDAVTLVDDSLPEVEQVRYQLVAVDAYDTVVAHSDVMAIFLALK